MIGSFNLSEILIFPVKDSEARKKFLFLALAYLAGFIIPILPFLLAMGYTARLMRSTMQGEAVHMPEWDKPEDMLKDGLVLFGLRLIYTLPIILIVLPVYILLVFMPIFAGSNQGSADQFVLPFVFLFMLVMVILFPLSLAVGILLPVAENHLVAHNDFAAGFRVREWWAIFRANWTGFLLAYLISLIASMGLSVLMSVAMMTIVLICVLPLIMPAISAYISVVMYAAFAQAYKEGRDRLDSPVRENITNASA
jgi:hypothetical protein